MAEKQAILRGLINGIAHELLPKTDIYSVWLDENTNLAEKLAEVINSLNGKVTPDQMAAAIEEALEGIDVEPPTGSAATPGAYEGTTVQKFRQALENNRRVFVPGGDYYLDGEIVIRDNCQLELAQDAVLYFTNTSGNCISMKQNAYLKGNHSTVSVPYAFTGNVINADTALSSAVNECPPFAKWDPQWKTGRYITDLNIVKPDYRGFYYSVNGEANGTAVYVCTDSADISRFMWGNHFSGIRIAGAFSYGLRAQNFGSGYNHEMRFEALMDACEIGVSLENVNNAYISATIQPRAAYTASEESIPYAKHGIQLVNSRNTDLSGSRVWDWNESTSLWTAEGIYQHIAMTGNCRGTILNDFFYYEMPQYDIRDLIYTDNPDNLEKINILQEPFTRWFKPIGNKPYFFNGDTTEELVCMDELNGLITFEDRPTFTNVLPAATDENGNVFNDVGYVKYGMWEIDGKTLTPTNWLGCTGYISCKAGQAIRAKGIKFTNANDYSRIIMFDANHNKLHHVNHSIFTSAPYFLDYVETEDGFEMTVKPAGACVDTAYIKLNFPMAGLSKNPVIAIDQEIGFEYSGHLAEGIKVSADQIEGTIPGGGGGSGGGGADLLDENGIIKQEYLPEGFPYKSGDDNAVILPTVTLEPIPDMDGQMAIADALEIFVGEEYTVNWNGTEYKTKCVSMPNVSGEEAEFYAGALGNVGAMGGEMTEEPFLIIAVVKEAVADVGIGALVFPIDGSTSATISITGFKGKFQPIDNMYLRTGPETVIVDLRQTDLFESSYTPEEILDALLSGKDVKIYYEESFGTGLYTVFSAETFTKTMATFSRIVTGYTDTLYIEYFNIRPKDLVPIKFSRAEVALVVK